MPGCRGALGRITKTLDELPEKLNVKINAVLLQKTAMLGTTVIFVKGTSETRLMLIPCFLWDNERRNISWCFRIKDNINFTTITIIIIIIIIIIIYIKYKVLQMNPLGTRKNPSPRWDSNPRPSVI